jgi:hypothetical protein
MKVHLRQHKALRAHLDPQLLISDQDCPVHLTGIVSASGQNARQQSVIV